MIDEILAVTRIKTPESFVPACVSETDKGVFVMSIVAGFTGST